MPHPLLADAPGITGATISGAITCLIAPAMFAATRHPSPVAGRLPPRYALAELVSDCSTADFDSSRRWHCDRAPGG